MPIDFQSSIPSGLRDNYSRGKAGDFLRDHITEDTTLSFVSAYFTVHAHHALRDVLECVGSLRFLFGGASFIRNIEKERKESRQFKLGDQGIVLVNQLTQEKVARDCADWIRQKVEIRSFSLTNFLHGKMYHNINGKVSHYIPALMLMFPLPASRKSANFSPRFKLSLKPRATP